MPKWLRQELPDIKKSTTAAWIYRRYDISLRDFLKITLSGIGLLLITADIFYHNLLAAAVLCPYLHFRLKIKSEELHKQRRERLKMQFKDGMQSVAFSLNSGYSIENAWKEAIVEMRLLYGENSEIVTEFQRIINRLERNENIEDVLEEFAKKSGVVGKSNSSVTSVVSTEGTLIRSKPRWKLATLPPKKMMPLGLISRRIFSAASISLAQPPLQCHSLFPPHPRHEPAIHHNGRKALQ